MSASISPKPEMHKITLRRLRSAAKSYDTESAHAEADSALIDLLLHLGYQGVVDAYNKVGKWYS